MFANGGVAFRRELRTCVVSDQPGLRVGLGCSTEAIAALRTRPFPLSINLCKELAPMSTIATSDGAPIYYKDWGEGPAVTLSHGWPLSADAWDGQMLFLAQNGFRAIAHDRRSHGRSGQASAGNDTNTYADDLAAVIDALDLHDITGVGHSTGGGGVARYIGRHGAARLAKAVLISVVPPHLAPNQADRKGCRWSYSTVCSLACSTIDPSCTGTSRSSSTAPTGPTPSSRRAYLTKSGPGACDQASRNSFECVQALRETDFTEDLERFDVPTLLIHGEDDQIVPVTNSVRSARVIKNDKDIYYPAAPHGITATHQDQVNPDLLAVLRS